MESICYTTFNNLDELMSVVVVLRQWMQTDDFNKFHAKEVLNAILTLASKTQEEMMVQAELEY
jgi:hypothetical protein